MSEFDISADTPSDGSVTRRRFIAAGGTVVAGAAMAATASSSRGAQIGKLIGHSSRQSPLIGLSIPTLSVAVFTDFVEGAKEFQKKAGLTNAPQVMVNNGSAQTQVQQV